MEQKDVTFGEAAKGCFSLFIFIMFFSVFVGPYIAVVIEVSQKLMESGLVWYLAILKAAAWPVYLTDTIVQIMLSR